MAPRFEPVVLGVDTGFAFVGWTALRVCSGAFSAVEVLDAGVFRTESSAKKLKIKIGDDDFSRTRLISAELHRVIGQYGPRMITCEAFSPMRNAGTVAKIGRCFGALACLSVVHDLPVLHATPMEIKKATAGHKGASKEEVQTALRSKGPGNALAVRLDAKRIPEGQREHAFDALGSVLACWDDDMMRLLRGGA